MITRHAIYARAEPTTASYIPKKFLVKRQDPPPTTAADSAAPTETPPQTTAAEDPAAPTDVPTESASGSGSEVPPEPECTAPPQELQPYGTIVANDPGEAGYPVKKCDGALYRVRDGDTCSSLIDKMNGHYKSIGHGEWVHIDLFMTANRVINKNCSNLYINQELCIPGFPELPEEFTKFIEPPPPPVETPPPTATEGDNPGETAISSEGAVPEETPKPGEGQNQEAQNGEGQNGEGQNGEGQNGEGQNGEGQNGEGQNGEGEQIQPDGQTEQEQAQQKRYAPTPTFTYEGRSYGFQTVRRDLAHDVHTNSDLPTEPHHVIPRVASPEASNRHLLVARGSKNIGAPLIAGSLILLLTPFWAWCGMWVFKKCKKVKAEKQAEKEAQES